MPKKYNHLDFQYNGRRQWIKVVFMASSSRVALGTSLSLIAVGLQLLNPWPLKILIDSVFGKVFAPGPLHGLTGTYTLLVIVAVSYVSLYMLSGLLEIIDAYLTARFSNNLSIQLQTSFFYHIINLPQETRRKIDSGDYVYRLNEQADNLPVLIFSTFVSVIASLFTIGAALVILAILDWQMAIVGLLVVPLLFFSIRYFAPRIEAGADEIAVVSSDVYNQSSESIDNVSLIQAFNRQAFQTQKFTDLLRLRARKSLKLTVLNEKFDYTNNIFTASGVAIVLMLGGYKVFHGTLTVGELLIFVTYTSYLYDPIENILSSIGQYKGLLAGIKRVYSVLSEKADLPDSAVGLDISGTVTGSIEFKDVCFSYGQKTVLDHVSFQISPGQKVAFVGASGSGKSTVLSLLPRFSRVNSGFIYLDGNEIGQINLASLRNQFGVVSQEAELFSGSVQDNIGFAIPDEQLALPDIMIAAEAANANGFIKKLPQGFDTEVGEGGSSLSGGQKQRISIARAFVKNPPILLLDEPTSALDRASSTKIIAAIKKLMVGKTVLMATHEISLLKEMDAVYVVDQGSVSKIDDPEKLADYIDSLSKVDERVPDLKLL